MYIFGIIQLFEFSIQINYPDCPTGYPISDGYHPSYIRIQYLDKVSNSYPIKKGVPKISGYSKTNLTVRAILEIYIPFTSLTITTQQNILICWKIILVRYTIFILKCFQYGSNVGGISALPRDQIMLQSILNQN